MSGSKLKAGEKITITLLLSLLIGFLLVNLDKVPASDEGVFEPGARQGSVSTAISTAACKAKFLSTAGDRYGYNGRIDEIYKREIEPRLGPDTHYLDYTGAAIPWNSQVPHYLVRLQKLLACCSHHNHKTAKLGRHTGEET